MAITSGALFPPYPYQTARAVSLCLDTSGNIALSSMSYASGIESGTIWAYDPTKQAWIQEPPGPYYFQEPIAVEPGYTLDSFRGLWSWGGGILVSGNAPYTSMFSGVSGIYVTTPNALYTSGNTQVSGVNTSGIFASLASGMNPWLLSSGAVFQVDFTTPTSGSVLTTTLPFTGTCMAASGSSLVVAGVGNLNLGSGGYALTVGVSGTALVCFPGSGLAVTWLLTGEPYQEWTHLATSSGLPTYSSGISVAWPAPGNSLVLSDYILGNWTSYLYTGGVLTFQTSGAIAGSARGIAATTNGQYVGIPNPGSSGVYIVESTGATWSGLGVVAIGDFPDCGAIAGISTTSFAVGSSGQVALLNYVNSGWVSGSPILIDATPSAAYYDPTLGHVLWAANSGYFASTQWLTLSYGLLVSGVWSNTSGVVIDIASQRYQALVITEDSYNMAGVGPHGTSINYWTQPATGLTSIGIPIPADYSFPILTLNNGLEFQNFTAPYQIAPLKSGQWGTIASGGAAIANLTMLGQGILPSALGYGMDGNLLLATTRGALGPLASGSTGLTYMLASGGFTDMLTTSGQTWLSTTVQGSLVFVSGI